MVKSRGSGVVICFMHLTVKMAGVATMRSISVHIPLMMSRNRGVCMCGMRGFLVMILGTNLYRVSDHQKQGKNKGKWGNQTS